MHAYLNSARSQSIMIVNTLYYSTYKQFELESVL